jgi:hypothetical protein
MELSQVLPNDTFVSDLIFKEGVFEINGLSGQAAALPQIIDNSLYSRTWNSLQRLLEVRLLQTRKDTGCG